MTLTLLFKIGKKYGLFIFKALKLVSYFPQNLESQWLMRNHQYAVMAVLHTLELGTALSRSLLVQPKTTVLNIFPRRLKAFLEQNLILKLDFSIFNCFFFLIIVNTYEHLWFSKFTLRYSLILIESINKNCKSHLPIKWIKCLFTNKWESCS